MATKLTGRLTCACGRPAQLPKLSVSFDGWRSGRRLVVPGALRRKGRGGVLPPNKAVLVIERVLVESDSDVATVYALTRQIQLTPLSQWKSVK